ncbi:DUF2723 domain-containing protein [Hymenobacter sp. 15J16-1T3B]|uniref:glycosyltransferase family 117 protein n=1 Tax=Hymenobacter sp. 15J16-1T3B TaxID=2886941 RepID=UPI001D121119|nr:DUF2723 domain-containing protein [Hymenobacter sp. 15J16-1T3B]MCC3158133.1 DUF2723 domain-containing protein [Hymenobacter sp. 15J16-1T3B]
MQYSKLNNLAGGLVFAAALATYCLTLEPTVSFWDCGEFIASADKLQVPHPPGAPTFLLLGRLASLLSFGEASRVAVLVNLLSALSSACTVLLLFWSITLLARKLVLGAATPAAEPDDSQAALILSSGAVGALAFAFSDSFWFNAVEAEVYALSSLGTALVLWLMLKWEHRADAPDADKWLVLIAYVIGLSIGVHLLNLLALPALGLIYYFRRTAAPTTRGLLLTLAGSGAAVLTILLGVIPGLPSVAGALEIFCVNALRLPYNAGVVLFGLLLAGGLAYGLRAAARQQQRLLYTSLLSLVFVLIGYSTYLIVPIRSGFNPLIDENNPEDVLSFVSYLKREQYGDRPLLYGPQFNAQPVVQTDGAPRYERRNGRYEVVEQKLVSEYAAADKMLLPRLYSQQPGHLREYQKWTNVQPEQRPSMADNLGFLVRYQLGHMYWRYFLWNFVGRDADVQQAGVLWPTETKSGLPAGLADNRARNNYFALPLLLGLAGLVFQLRRDGRNAAVVGLLFALTGVAIVLYLNQPPLEPRERDYTFVGSFYAFAIWIGLGVLGLHAALRAVLRQEQLRVATVAALGLAVPVLMATEGWDDHNRSERTLALDWAHNLLNSVAPNALLVTAGDNDTFPLWYAQQVEGIRPDVRIAVSPYLNTDWYIDQLQQRMGPSAALPMTLRHPDYTQGTNDYLPLVTNPAVAAVDARQFVQLVKQNSPLLQVQTQSGRTLLSYPTRQFYLDVDTAAVRRAGLVPAERRGQLTARMQWQAGAGGYLEKKELALLDILAQNNWQRPVYFSAYMSPSEYAGLEPYLQLEGLAYRVLPLQNPAPQAEQRGEIGYVARELLFDSLMRKFTYRNLANPRVYYDESQRRVVGAYREEFARLAQAYYHDGNLAKAKQVVDRCLRVMPDDTVPFDYNTADLVAPLAAAGEAPRAQRLMDMLTNRAQQNLAYYRSHEPALFEREIQVNAVMLSRLYQAAADTNDTARAQRIVGLLEQYVPRS